MAEKIDKPKIKQVMLDYLTKIGYPNIPNEEIMRHLPRIFVELDRQDLIPEAMNYGIFYKIAVTKYFEARFGV